MTIKVRQREYAIGKRETNSSILITKNIWTCTGLYGIDKTNGVVFLAHFDFPYINALCELVAELKTHVNGDFSGFEIGIITGSAGKVLTELTRFCIRKKLKELNVFPKIPKNKYVPLLCSVTVNANTGSFEIEKYLLRQEKADYEVANGQGFKMTKSQGSA